MEPHTNRRILNGWKQISQHIDRGVRTAQRWEALLGMPIHRPALKDRSAVVAFSDELESWLSRTSPDAREECEAVCDKDKNQERLLRVLDNMSTLVQQSCDLLSQVKLLEEQLRRSRKARRMALRSRARAAAAARRSSVLSLPGRRLAAMTAARGVR